MLCKIFKTMPYGLIIVAALNLGVSLSSCGPIPTADQGNTPERPENDAVVTMRPAGEVLRMPSSTGTASAAPVSSSGASAKSSKSLSAGFLKAHNTVRKALKLPELQWDDQIAVYAQEWADKLKKAGCTMQHRSGSDKRKRLGENLAWNWSSSKASKTPEYSTANWVSERKDYNAATNTCKAGKVCGHYTQVVWKTSKKMGCGVAICDGSSNSQGSGRSEIWVCNYDPPGNIIGKKPF